MATYMDLGGFARMAAADLSEKLFYLARINTDGKIALSAAGETVDGVISEGAVADKPVTIQIGGLAKVICGATVAAGARLSADVNGKAVTSTTGAFEFGTAVNGGDANEIITVRLATGRAA